MQEPVKQVSSKEFAEQLLYGQLKELKLPSGFDVTIREQNGHDDDILSNQAMAKDLSNINMFISSLVIETNLPFAKGGKLSLDAVKKMALRDKYFIIFASRIHSIGSEITFSYDWGADRGGELTYTDDLNNFIWDYNQPVPTEDSSDYYPYRLLPYKINPYEEQEVALSSGKLIRFTPLNGEGESKLLKVPADKQTRNTELKARDLKQYSTGGTWVAVENFLHFSKKDMVELHKVINEVDKDWKGFTKLENPSYDESTLFPIVAVPDFFFPAEI